MSWKLTNLLQNRFMCRFHLLRVVDKENRRGSWNQTMGTTPIDYKLLSWPTLHQHNDLRFMRLDAHSHCHQFVVVQIATYWSLVDRVGRDMWQSRLPRHWVLQRLRLFVVRPMSTFIIRWVLRTSTITDPPTIWLANYNRHQTLLSASSSSSSPPTSTNTVQKNDEQHRFHFILDCWLLYKWWPEGCHVWVSIRIGNDHRRMGWCHPIISIND